MSDLPAGTVNYDHCLAPEFSADPWPGTIDSAREDFSGTSPQERAPPGITLTGGMKLPVFRRYGHRDDITGDSHTAVVLNR